MTLTGVNTIFACAGIPNAENNDITATNVHFLDFILPPFHLWLMGRKAVSAQRLSAMPSLNQTSQRHSVVAGEHQAALESALDGFPDRIHPHSSRTVTPLRFQSPSKVLENLWIIYCSPYEQADKALLRVRSVSSGLGEACPGARRCSRLPCSQA